MKLFAFQMLFAWVGAVASLLGSASAFAQAEGHLKITDEDLAEHKLVLLDTPWEYYDQRWLTPQELASNSELKPTHLIGPRSMRRYHKEGLSRGWGTYRLKVTTESVSAMTLSFVELRSAIKLWIDGELITEMGTLGKTQEEEVTDVDWREYTFTPKSNTFDIVIQNSNFHHNTRLTIYPIRLGYPASISHFVKRVTLSDGISVGAIYIMAFYHIILYFLRKENRAPLWFGMFCFLVATRTFCASESQLLYYLFDDFHIEFKFKTEMLTYTFGVVTFSRFARILYPKEMPKLLIWSVIYPSFLYSAIIVATPVTTYMGLLDYYQFVTLIGIVGIISGAVRASLKKRIGSYLFTLGFVVLSCAVVHDILASSGVFISKFTLTHFGLFVFILTQSIILSRRFARDFVMLKIAEAENRSLNETLEKKVEERTETIRTIYDNVKSGFLLVDSEVKVMDGFTKSCLDLFGGPITSGDSFGKLLHLNDRDCEQFNLAIQQTFDGLLPPEVCLAQIQPRYQIKDRFVSIHGSPVKSRDGKIIAVLFTATNDTALVKTEQELELSRTLLKISREKQSFQELLQESYTSIEHGREDIDNGEPNHLRMILHTLKGNFASFGLVEVARYIHDLEARESLTAEDLFGIKERINSFIETHAHVVGLNLAGQTKSVVLSTEKLQELSRRLQQLGSGPQVLAAVNQWVKEVKLVTVKRYFDNLTTTATELAQELGKVVDVVVTGADVLVEPEETHLIMQNLVHLIRNSVDHGIEYPDERGDKPERGRLEIGAVQNEQYLQITIRDDGAGLNLQKITELAIEKGLINAEAADSISDDDIKKLIFLEGFSTRSEVTSISGRGIGMSALLQTVRDSGGDIVVQSSPGKGTEFTVLIGVAADLRKSA
ncbi:MAG: Hpt domain-containing protein [Pseudobacteriovorax sp.]|nr:Hpt domain-containing protein [Pseudobacteriovorax sp.]